MSELKVDPDELDSAVADIRASVTNVETSLDTLTVDLQSLSAQWTGAASDAFQSAYRSWNGDMSRMAANLRAVADLLHRASVAYTRTEAAVVERCS